MPNQSADELLREVRVWRHNRSLYPGWLIAPDSVRRRVWNHTKHWVLQFLQVRSQLNEEQELDVLFELNWRLETSLVPIWDDLAPAYEHVLRAINPFPHDITDQPTATVVLSEGTRREVNRATLRKQWLAVAFGILRSYREQLQVQSFEQWHARLSGISALDNEARAKLAYERCLFALGEMNDEAALQALGSWSEVTYDPFWAIRRAAVLSELGRTDEALNAAESSLKSLQNGLVDGFERIPSLSRESLATNLVMALHQNRRHGQGTWSPADELAERAEIRRRYNKLQRFGCSPSDLTDYFEGRLDRPIPQPRRDVESTPGFQPATYSHTVHFGDNALLETLLPAYQYLRFIEEAAQPPRIAQVTIGMGELMKVADWFCEYDQVRAQSLIFRLQEEKLLNRFLTRHRVAALGSEVVGRMKSLADRAVEHSLPNVSASARSEDDLQRRIRQRLRTGLEILSRAWVREPDADLDNLWNFACAMYRHPALRAGMSNDGLVRNLFETLTVCTSPREISQRLPALFQLPIPGEEGFQVAIHERWPDPAEMAAQKITRPQTNTSIRNWREIKARLLTLVQAENAQLRQSALARLVELDRLTVLLHQERRRLGEIFWAPVRGQATLPFAAWGPFTAWYALSLPAPQGVDPGEQVRQHILGARLGAVHDGMVWPEAILRLIVFATPNLGHSWQPANHRHYIGWTTPDVRTLFATIRNWWAAHGREMVNQPDSLRYFHTFTGGSTSRFLSGLWDVMRTAILPRMRRSRSSAQAVRTFIEDVSSAGMPIGSVLPATLILQPDSLDQVASHLRKEFVNPQAEFHLSALRGVVYWVDRQTMDTRRRPGQLPKIPIDLLRELGTAVALRRPGLLAVALDCAFHVLARLGAAADKQFARSLIVGLEYLFSETDYRLSADVDSAFDYEAVPRLRQLSARLAKRLSSQGYAEDPTVRRWCEVAATDPLPEVRRKVVDSDPE